VTECRTRRRRMTVTSNYRWACSCQPCSAHSPCSSAASAAVYVAAAAATVAWQRANISHYSTVSRPRISHSVRKSDALVNCSSSNDLTPRANNPKPIPIVWCCQSGAVFQLQRSRPRCSVIYTSLFTIMAANEKKNRKTDRTET